MIRTRSTFSGRRSSTLVGIVLMGLMPLVGSQRASSSPAPDIPQRRTWQAEGDQSNAWFGQSANTAGDVDGDGYDDVIVGAPGYDHGETDEGRVFVYKGSANGPSSIPTWTEDGDLINALFGESVSTAGDVNGDGYDDVIVGIRQYNRAFVYHGSAGGLSTTPDWVGGTPRGTTEFGYSVSTAGDVNGDGYDDVIVGAPDYHNGQAFEGAAYLYQGSPNGLSATPNWIGESDRTNASLGISVSDAGDVNGDGFGDVIVGAPYFSLGKHAEGVSFVYQGSADGLSTTPDWVAQGNQEEALLGNSVSGAGDVDGDGYDDVIVGAELFDDDQVNEGAALAYQGSAGGLSTTPSWIVMGDEVGAFMGSSVGGAGDVNGDGYDDVVVGADLFGRGHQDDEGRATLYYGSVGGLSTTPDWTAEGNQVSSSFGYSVAGAGDVDGDGYADVIVGAYRYDHGEEDEGRAYVYAGRAGT